MTQASDIIAAIDDARALLDALVTSDWREIHARAGATEIFIAHDGGRENPMRSRASSAALPTRATGNRPAPIAQTDVRAPHVATVVDILPEGARVVAGQVVATVRVLDREETVGSVVAGTVEAVQVATGDLVEYGTRLLTIAGDAS